MRKSLKPIVVLLIVVCGLAVMWPTAAAAVQDQYGFNQSWLILGPYYRKNTGANPGNTALRLDYLMDGAGITQTNIIPTTGMIVNTAYAMPQCGSYSFVWRTRANGYSVPTVFRYESPSDGINYQGLGVFDQAAGWGSGNPQGDNRLNNSMCYAFAWANNVSGADIPNCRFGVGSDDSIRVMMDGAERYINNTSRGWGNALEVQNQSSAFTLTTGLHLVAVETYNGGGGFGFRCRLQKASWTGTESGAPNLTRVLLPAEVLWQITGPGYAYPPPTIPGIPANQATGVRDILLRDSYVPGVATQVNLTVTTSSGHPDPVIVREFPPAGWTTVIAGTPSLGSATVVDTTTLSGYSGKVINWDIGPMTLATTNVARLTYMTTPPPGATDVAYSTGTVTSDAQRVLGRGQTNAQTGAANQFNPPAPTLGAFDWAGNIGVTIMGFGKQRWTGNNYGYGRPAFPPLTSGTRITGDPRSLGKASFAGGTYTITAGGHDIWDNNDAFFGVFKRQAGNFILQADVRWTSTVGPYLVPGARATGASEWCKAGLMARYSTQGGSPNTLTGIRRYWNNTAPGTPQTQFFGQWRDVQWAGCGSLGELWTTSKTLAGLTNPQPSAPATIKLVRRGSTFDYFHYYQGTWQRAAAGGLHTNPGLTTATLLVGMAVTSHYSGSNDNLTDADTSVTADFSSVTLTPGVPVESATRTFLSGDVDMLGAPAYSSKTITVRIALVNGGGTGNLTVREYAPTSWTISSISHGGVVDPRGTTITWTLNGFAASTTLTYNGVPPQLGIIPITWPVAAQFFQSPLGATAVVNDLTNLIDAPILGQSLMLGYRVNLFQQGRYPNSSYAGTQDTHIYMYRSQARYLDWGGPILAAGCNSGWWANIDEGNNHASSNNLLYNRNDDKVMVLRFETSSLDPGYTVFGAALMLNLNTIRIQPAGQTATTSSVHRIYAARINRPWSEGRGDGADGPFVNLGEVCWIWNQAFQSQWASWGIRGGAIDGEMPESFYDISVATVGKWNVWDVSTMATQWIKTPSINFGVKLSQDDQNTTHYPTWATWPYTMFACGVFNFASAQNGTAAIRPMLAVVAYKPDVLAASHWELYR